MAIQARIIVGANYGDEGKGTVAAHYTKHAQGNVLNILTNGGSQRGHTIVTEHGGTTFKHFGAGTYFGADNYYSRYFVLNPMQFAMEYETLQVKPQHVWRDNRCLWSTPYDTMANIIVENTQNRHASCCMGIWNTMRRAKQFEYVSFDTFVKEFSPLERYQYLARIKAYYENNVLSIPDYWKLTWNAEGIATHFINDCMFMYNCTTPVTAENFMRVCGWMYDTLIFENGQGLMLSDRGKDESDRTPSDCGIRYSMQLLRDLGITDVDVTAHYVTRPYLTRHGDGVLINEQTRMSNVSSYIGEDTCNHYNEFQGEFRYGLLDIADMKRRIVTDARGVKLELELTHCDEMDRTREFAREFDVVNTYDSALIK